MTIEAAEFIRRFLLHILPHRFYKIRYYGILSLRSHETTLSRCQKILNSVDEQQDIPSIDRNKLYFQHTGIDLKACPVCQKGQMRSKDNKLCFKSCLLIGILILPV